MPTHRTTVVIFKIIHLKFLEYSSTGNTFYLVKISFNRSFVIDLIKIQIVSFYLLSIDGLVFLEYSIPTTPRSNKFYSNLKKELTTTCVVLFISLRDDDLLSFIIVNL